jgi:outer membrane protein assembly factor BamB
MNDDDEFGDEASAPVSACSMNAWLVSFSCPHSTHGWPLLLLLLGVVVLAARPGLAETGNLAITNPWIARVGFHGESAPAVAPGGNVYLTTFSGSLAVFNAAGALLWQYDFGFETQSTPALGPDGTAYFGCRDRRIHAVGADGKPRWTFKTGAWVDASPALGADGTIYCGSWDGNFYALNSDGTKKWDSPTGKPITSSAAIDAAGVIYFGGHDQKLYALHADGSQKWEFRTGGAILSSPALGSDGAVYFTSTDGHLFALNPDGTRRWKLHTGGISSCSPVLGPEETVFLGVNTNYCEVSAAGKLLWARSMDPRGHPPMDWLVATPVALADGTVFTGGTDLHLSIFQRGGAGRWHQGVRSAVRAAPVVLSTGRAYAATTGTGLFAFDGFPPPAASAWPMFRGNPQRTGRVGER